MSFIFFIVHILHIKTKYNKVRITEVTHWILVKIISSLFFVEEHSGEEPAEEFPLHRRKEQKRQKQPVVAAAAARMTVCRTWMFRLCRDFHLSGPLFALWYNLFYTLWTLDHMSWLDQIMTFDSCGLWNGTSLWTWIFKISKNLKKGTKCLWKCLLKWNDFFSKTEYLFYCGGGGGGVYMVMCSRYNLHHFSVLTY